MILIAHEDDCDLRPKTGIAVDFETDERREVWEPCSCGGVKVSVPIWTPSNTGIAELDFPTGGPA